jgi:branched-chain amino acid transport system permease protein
MLGGYLFMALSGANTTLSNEMTSSPSIIEGIAISVIAAMAVIAIAYVTYAVFIAPFMVSNALLVFVTTLSLSIIIESSVSMVFGVNVRSLGVFYSEDSFEWGSVFITPIQILIIISALVSLLASAIIIHLTPVGRQIRALSAHSAAAESLGIYRRQISIFVCILSVAFATLAGILIGYETNLYPTMGTTYTIKAFAALLLGGLGNIWGTIAGSYLLGIVENFSIGIDLGDYSLPAGYKDAFAYAIIVLVLVFKPEGLFGQLQRKA